MSKELFISSTPHETKLAIVEDDLLSEVYFERENEYTLAGSIYKGRVTRVLPGMQSAFVDVGLERDAFLYVTDFLEETEDHEEFDRVVSLAQAAANKNYEAEPASGGFRRAPEGVSAPEHAGADPAAQFQAAASGNGPAAGFGAHGVLNAAGEDEEDDAGGTGRAPQGEKSSEGGTKRWRGRRGRRGRGGREQNAFGARPVGNEDAAGERLEAGGNVSDEKFEKQPFVAPVKTERTPERAAERTPERPSEIRRAVPPATKSPAYQPMVLPGESISKYRRQAPVTPPSSDSQVAETSSGLQQESASSPASHFAAGQDAAPREYASALEESGSGWKTAPVQQTTICHSEHAPVGFGVTTPAESQFANKPSESSAGDRSHEDQGSDASAAAQQPQSSHLEEVTETRNQAEQTHGQMHDAQPYGAQAEGSGEPAHPEHAGQHAGEYVSPRVVEHIVEPTVQPGGEHDATPIVRSNPESQALEVSEQGVVAFGVADSPLSHQSRSGALTEEQQVVDEEEEASETSSFAEDLEDAAFDEFEEETLEGGSEPHIATPTIAGTQSPGENQSLDQDFGTEGPQTQGHDARGNQADHDGQQHFLGQTAGLDDELHHGNQAEQSGGHSEELPEDFNSAEDLAEEEEFDPLAVGPGTEELEPPNAEAGVRAPNATAAFQQTADRDVRRERFPRRGGRPPMQGGRGGPRRNTPRGPMPVISDLLKEGQEILVQIAKEPMAKKGARITSHIALPGRFLVFMPTVNHMGVSRKISSEEERQRLKRILLSERGTTHGGFIVRTAAAGASEEDLRADIRFLINLWVEIRARAESSKAPSLIYHDLNLVERILRDQVTQTYSQIWVDNEQEYERILRFVSRFQPSLVKRVKLYTKETPLFEQFNIQEEINKALKSKVWLKSGGSIVINQTEALVAIDINTGKYVGRTSRLEDTIVKTNVDAIKEIVRQIRLRDLGGIIVIDFIDMDERKNRNKVMQALEEALKSDRAPSKVLQFNDFGLVAITRKRVKQSLERTLGATCEYCTGTGMIKSVTTVCNEIYVEMRKMAKHFERQDVMLRAHPEVIKALKSGTGKWLQEMEELTGRTIILKSDTGQHQEQFDIQ